MAWYPLYRIPEAPLDARFLTYHSVALLWEMVREAQGAVEVPPPALQHIGAGHGTGAAMPASPGAAAASCGGCVQLSPFAAARHMAAAATPPAAGSISTPTGVCSFPGSPTCSDAATRTTNGSAPPPSGSGASHPRSDAGSVPSAGSGCGSMSGSPAGSELGDAVAESLRCQPIRVPVVGLQWYTMPRSVENWTDTLVAAHLPEGEGEKGLRQGVAGVLSASDHQSGI